MRRLHRSFCAFGIGLWALGVSGPPAVAPAAASGLSQNIATPSPALRLYVFDCGDLGGPNPLSMAAYLIVHPKGSLLWEACGLPDDRIESGAGTDGLQANLKNASSKKTLRAQLREIGYSPSRITFFALSHYHDDHSANANDYRASTWLVQKPERDAMFAPGPPPRFAEPSFYSGLKNSKTVLLAGDHDVFGDGAVVIKSTPGHTPGHQSLFVRLPKTGPIVLSGDLYHRQDERANHEAPPSYDSDATQDAASRQSMESFLAKTGATLWIEHDMKFFQTLKKSPAYYD